MDNIDAYAEENVKFRIKSCLESVPTMLAWENKKFMLSRIGNVGASAVSFNHYAPALEWLGMICLANVGHSVSEPRLPLEERIRVKDFKLYMMGIDLLMSHHNRASSEVFFGNPDVNAENGGRERRRSDANSP